MRTATLCFGLALALGLVAAFPSHAEEPVGGISFHGRTLAMGVGFSWGSGTLHFQGKNHAFKVQGLSVGQAGAADMTASGSVYRLKRLSDFDGNYTAAAGDITVGGGEGGAVMQNQNGVVIKVRATSQGANAKIASEGLKITLK